MTIDGLHWFIAALVVFGLHAAWAKYDADSERRHQEFMVELRRARSGEPPRERAKA